MTTHMETQEVREDRFGRSIIARLNTSTDDLPRDISERLKVARIQALTKRKIVKVQLDTAHEISRSGDVAVLHPGEDQPGLWNWLGSLLPLLALVAGLMMITWIQDSLRAREIAEVDAELLTDVLPPVAYTDPGFAQYLRGLKEN